MQDESPGGRKTDHRTGRPRRTSAAAGVPGAEGSGLIDVRAAPVYLAVTEAFVRRLVLERRVRYYKVGKFVRFRRDDLEALVEAGRIDPNAMRPIVGSRLVSHRTRPQRARPTPS